MPMSKRPSNINRRKRPPKPLGSKTKHRHKARQLRKMRSGKQVERPSNADFEA